MVENATLKGPFARRQNLLPYEGEVYVIDEGPEFNAPEITRTLIDTIPWQQETARLFGKSQPFPRLTAWFGDVGYHYSGVYHPPAPPPEIVAGLRDRAEMHCGVKFNAVLLNFYRDGRDSVSWHSDAEPGLGPVIASLSLGGTRRFQLRHRDTKEEKVTIELIPGRWVIMAGETQKHWQHQVPKTAAQAEPRVNLTFRTMGEMDEPASAGPA